MLGSLGKIQDRLQVDDLRCRFPDRRVYLGQPLQIAQFFFFNDAFVIHDLPSSEKNVPHLTGMGK